MLLSMSDPVKPKKPNLIMPVSPMFAAIMTIPASKLVKQVCEVVNMHGYSSETIDVVKESVWGNGVGNENLEKSTLSVGTVGLVVDIAEPRTVLRFLSNNSIYHVNVLNLKPVNK